MTSAFSLRTSSSDAPAITTKRSARPKWARIRFAWISGFEVAIARGFPVAPIASSASRTPSYGRASVDFVADQPGLTLFHCHIQHHMDFGFKALFRYA